jgi:hypothetical protein
MVKRVKSRRHFLSYISSRYSRCPQCKRLPRCEPLENRVLLSITSVLRSHNDSNSDGLYSTETLLTPTNVSGGNFGRIFDTRVDGQVYAQPLAVPNVNITGGSSLGVHNVIYVATMHDSLFAIDATSGQVLWQDSFLQISNPQVTTVLSPIPTVGVTPVPAVTGDNATIDSSNVGPEMGTIATPVIDPSTNILYVVTYTQELRNGTTPSATGSDFHYVERLWAVNIADGSVAISSHNSASIEPSSGGQVIADTVLNPTSGNTVPSFTSYTNYVFDVGPFVKGTGNNAPTVSSSTPGDGWTSSAATSFFAGATPQSQGYIAFNALTQMGRVSLTLINGTIYMGYASHGDNGPYYGWLLGYSASTLNLTAAIVSDPSYESFSLVSGDDSKYDAQGGFWGAGTAIATDGTYLYISTGNGAFNTSTSNFNNNYFSMDGTHKVLQPIDGDYGDAVLKLQIDPGASQGGTPSTTTYNPDNYDLNGFGLKIVDYFVPSNTFEMNHADEDLGSGGVMMIPSTGPGSMTAPDGDPMLVTGGKEGRIYLLDAGNLGGFNTAYDPFQTTNNDPSPYDRVLGEYYYYGALNPGVGANSGSDKIYATAGYLNGNIYIGIGGNASNGIYLPEIGMPVSSLLAGTSPPGTATSATISSQTTNNFGGRGTTPTISSNGLGNGIIWSVVSSLSTTDSLMAYSASNLGTTLYSSETNATQDSLTNGGAIPGTRLTGATAAKFNVATVFNGMVYDGTGGGSGVSGHAEGTLVAYGLLPTLVQTGSNFNAPTALTGSVTSATDYHLSWTINSADEDEFEIQRSTNAGSTWSTLAYVQHGVNNYDDNTIVAGQNYQYRVCGASGGTIVLPATGNPTTPITTAFTNTVALTDAFPGTSAADQWTLKVDNSDHTNDDLWIGPTSGSPIIFAINSVPSLSFDAAAAGSISGNSDVLTIDLSNGNPVPIGGVIYSRSGSGSATLAVLGSPTAANNISLSSSGLTIDSSPTIALTNIASVSFDGQGGGSDTVSVTGGPVLIFPDTQKLASLTITGSGASAQVTMGAGAVIVTSALTITSNGKLDLTNNDLILKSGGAAGLTNVTGLLNSGFNLANHGYWNGPGLTSSAAAGDPMLLKALGAILNKTVAGLPVFSTFDGQSVSTTDVLVKYTYYGDANLDGKVDGTDYSLIDTGFNGKLTGWRNGDFNYDGGVDGSDYSLIDNAFNSQGAPIPSAMMVAPATDRTSLRKTTLTAPSLGNPVFSTTAFSSVPLDDALDIFQQSRGTRRIHHARPYSTPTWPIASQMSREKGQP